MGRHRREIAGEGFPGLLLALGILLGAAGPGAAQPLPPIAGGDLAYDTALLAAKANPAQADLRELRLAFTRTRGYAPNRARYPDQGPDMREALRAQDWPRVLRLAQAALEANYVRMQAHHVAALAHRNLGHRDRASYHRAFFSGLYRSIVEGSDGTTPATAYQVISIEEQYDVLAVRRLTRERQETTQHEGRAIDVITAKDADGATVTLYFDVSLPLARLGEERSPLGR